MFFFFGILISKQIALAFLFSFPLRIKTPFRKNINYDSIFFYVYALSRPCSHFYFDINFGNRLYSKEKSLASSLWNIICYQIWYQTKSDYMDRAIGMYRKHPNYTYGRNLKTSPSNQARVIECPFLSIKKLTYLQRT